MDLIKSAIRSPVSVIVGVILVILFGFIGLTSLPIQLTPDVETPQITVQTMWGGATPYEIEKDIIKVQEEKLKSVRGLTELESSSYNNYGTVTLSFNLDTNIDEALLRVSNKVKEIGDYPDNVDEPTISTSGSNNSPVIWAMLKTTPGNDRKANTYQTFIEEEVRQFIDRIDGVGDVQIYGGVAEQLEVVIDTEKLAKYHMTIQEVINSLSQSNADISAGILGMEKKNYRIRTISEFRSEKDPLGVIIKDDGLRRVSLSDVAITRMGYATENSVCIHNKAQGIAIGITKEQGANVVQVTKKVRKIIDEINTKKLSAKGLALEMVYDEVGYIETAIAIVENNLFIGALLAIAILLLFLRSITATLTVALAIPISAVGSFIFMWLLGRNINIVSLAGISFAIGMLVDNSIVVLENIDRHRHSGESPWEAAYKGAKEVSGAVLASTATTVAVFLPIVFMKEEAGQLFKDIAIAISASILLSLFVSLFVIPSFMHELYILIKEKKKTQNKRSIFDRVGGFFGKVLMFLSDLTLKNWMTRIVTIVVLVGLSLGMVAVLLPPAEYLPQGNREFILSIFIPPPGYSVAKNLKLSDFMYNEINPYLQDKVVHDEELDQDISPITDAFFIGADSMTLMGIISKDKTKAKTLLGPINRILQKIPDVFGVAFQVGIFQNELSGGRSIDVNITGDSLDTIIQNAMVLYGSISQGIAGSQIRPVPSLEQSYPEFRIHPDRSKTIANRMTERELGIYADVIMDGRKITEFKADGRDKMDLVLRTDQEKVKSPEDVMKAMIVNGKGEMIRMEDVATSTYAQSVSQIYRLERERTITLEVTPPEAVALEQAMVDIDLIVTDLQQKQVLSRDVDVSIAGNADKLTQTGKALQWNLLLAILITYLLMSALLENFFYPLIIMFTIPMAAAGGFMGMAMVNRFVAPQPFDVLTMLGFVILVGTVVNNAILIVYQALHNVRTTQMTKMEAIRESVQTRLRPIFMSTLTSVFGLLPLTISTGSGSELYRGIGSVLLGGLTISTIFTLFLIPALLSFFLKRPRESKMVAYEQEV